MYSFAKFKFYVRTLKDGSFGAKSSPVFSSIETPLAAVCLEQWRDT